MKIGDVLKLEIRQSELFEDWYPRTLTHGFSESELVRGVKGKLVYRKFDLTLPIDVAKYACGSCDPTFVFTQRVTSDHWHIKEMRKHAELESGVEDADLFFDEYFGIKS